jgi:Matrixin
LRVDSQSGQLAASADLYSVDQSATQPEDNLHAVGSMPPRRSGIPIFPIKDYRLYLRATTIEPTETGLTLTFEAYRCNASTFLTLDTDTSAQWAFEGTFIAEMLPAAAPPGYPRPELFLVGDVSKVDETAPPRPVGRMQLGWVSSALRRAVVEIDRAPGANVPLDNHAGLDWQGAFQAFGWQVRPIVSDDDVTKIGDAPWGKADVEAARQNYQDSFDLDSEWRYYILVASQIVTPGSPFGFMYDNDRRQALYITSQFVFPQTEPEWGDLRGARFDQTVAFFRTALHETGHAMGLEHNSDGFHYMRPTEDIAKAASADQPFPANLDWSFAPEDVHRLRHWPDIVVRPGGLVWKAGADFERFVAQTPHMRDGTALPSGDPMQ